MCFDTKQYLLFNYITIFIENNTLQIQDYLGKYNMMFTNM